MEGMADRGDFWYVIFDSMRSDMPECSFFGQYSNEAFTFSYIDGLYTKRNPYGRNQNNPNSVVGMEIINDQVKWYENGQLRNTTKVPQRPFYLVYCTPYADTETLITYVPHSLASSNPDEHVTERFKRHAPKMNEPALYNIY